MIFLDFTVVLNSTNMKMTTPSLNMLVLLVWSLMTDGKFVFGLLKLLHVMVHQRSSLFPKMTTLVLLKVTLLIQRTADGSLLA